MTFTTTESKVKIMSSLKSNIILQIQRRQRLHHYSLLSNHTAVCGCVLNGKLQSTVKPTRLIFCVTLFVRPIKDNYLVLLTICFSSVFIHKNKQTNLFLLPRLTNLQCCCIALQKYEIALCMNPDNTSLKTHIHHHDHQLLLLLARRPTRQISRYQRQHKQATQN